MELGELAFWTITVADYAHAIGEAAARGGKQ